MFIFDLYKSRWRFSFSEAGTFSLSSQFIQYCNRVLKSVPVDEKILAGAVNNTELLRRRLFYIKRTVQPYFSLKKNTSSRDMDKTVPKEKLIELWSSRKKRAIKIIKNEGKWPNKVEPVVDKQKTEEYYDLEQSTNPFPL